MKSLEKLFPSNKKERKIKFYPGAYISFPSAKSISDEEFREFLKQKDNDFNINELLPLKNFYPMAYLVI